MTYQAYTMSALNTGSCFEGTYLKKSLLVCVQVSLQNFSMWLLLHVSPLKMLIRSAQDTVKRRSSNSPTGLCFWSSQVSGWGPYLSIFSIRGSPCVLLPSCSLELFSLMTFRAGKFLTERAMVSSIWGRRESVALHLLDQVTAASSASNSEEDTTTETWHPTWQSTPEGQTSCEPIHSSGGWPRPGKSA